VAEQNTKKHDFLLNGGILAIASFLVRFIGMIYRVPMVNIIGSEGNGYYSNAYSVYNILLLLSSYSLPLAVSKMVSARIALGKWKETKRIFSVALTFGIVVGLVFGLITFFGADFFCTNILKSPYAAIPLKWMAPTVFIMGILGVLRGFFQGLETTRPTAISQIIEQIVNAIVSVGAAFFLFRFGETIAASTGVQEYMYAWGAAGGTIGTGAGALSALVFCIVLYRAYRKTFRRKVKRDIHEKVSSKWKLNRILILTAVPVILSTATYNCIDLIDSAVFNNYMAGVGYAVKEYNAIWGDYNSAYLLLVHLPVAIASAIGSALVPSLAAAYAENNKQMVLEKVALAIRVTLVIAIPCAIGMTCLGGSLAKLLFPSISEEAVQYLLVGGLAVVTYSLSTVTNAILQGIGKMGKPVVHALISLAIHTGILVLLLYVFKLEIIAVIVSYVIFSLVMSILNLISIKRVLQYRIDPSRSFGVPFFAGLFLAGICYLVTVLVKLFMSGKLAIVVILLGSIGMGAIVYFVLIIKLGCFSRSQIRELPKGKTIVKLLEKVHLLSRG